MALDPTTHLQERPLIEVAFRDRTGAHHSATLSSSWLPTHFDNIELAAFDRSVEHAMAELFTPHGLTVLRIERVENHLTTELL